MYTGKIYHGDNVAYLGYTNSSVEFDIKGDGLIFKLVTGSVAACDAPTLRLYVDEKRLADFILAGDGVVNFGQMYGAGKKQSAFGDECPKDAVPFSLNDGTLYCDGKEESGQGNKNVDGIEVSGIRLSLIKNAPTSDDEISYNIRLSGLGGSKRSIRLVKVTEAAMSYVGIVGIDTDGKITEPEVDDEATVSIRGTKVKPILCGMRTESSATLR